MEWDKWMGWEILPQMNAERQSRKTKKKHLPRRRGDTEKIKSNSGQAEPSIQRTHRTSEDAESGRKTEYEY
jgi:hypothetical protein